jgi:hypothetical protein
VNVNPHMTKKCGVNNRSDDIEPIECIKSDRWRRVLHSLTHGSRICDLNESRILQI